MREFFIVFRSRAEAIRYFELLKTYNISSKVINTPSSVKVGCGLSIKMFSKDMQMAKIVLERGRFTSAVGFYYFSQNGNVIRL